MNDHGDTGREPERLTVARALGFALRDCNPEGDVFAGKVADALAAAYAQGALNMRTRAAAVCRHGEEDLADLIEALDLEVAR